MLFFIKWQIQWYFFLLIVHCRGLLFLAQSRLKGEQTKNCFPCLQNSYLRKCQNPTINIQNNRLNFMYSVNRNSLNRSYDWSNNSKTLDKDLPFKIKTNNMNAIKPLKIHSRKLPNDFWGESLKKLGKVQKSLQTERTKIYSTKHELSDSITYEDLLPEAKMTSFFKQIKDESSTNPASPARSPKFAGRKNLREADENKLAEDEKYVSEFTPSIDVNEQPSSPSSLYSPELGITFSNLHLQKTAEQKHDEQLLHQKVKSLEVRNLRKRIPAVPFTSGRKSSFERERLRPQGIRSAASRNSKNRSTKFIQQINLPKIKQAH